MLVGRINQKNVKFVIIGTLKILVLSMNYIFAMVVMVLLQKAISFNNIAIVCVNGSAYRINFWYMIHYSSIAAPLLIFKSHSAYRELLTSFL